MHDLKMQDWKMTDNRKESQGLENAGLENDGQNFSKLWAKLRGLENAPIPLHRSPSVYLHFKGVGRCVIQ